MNRIFWRGFCRFLFAMLVVGAIAVLPGSLSAKKKVSKRGAPVVPVSVLSRQIDGFHRSGMGSGRYGKLRFLGGLVLSSPWKGFGGWSDITVDRDGQRFLAVSDDGHWMRGAMRYRGLKLEGVSDVKRGELQALSGRVLDHKRERDAEGVSLVGGTVDNGSLLISFERIHRIGKFGARKGGVSGPKRYLKLPREARSLSRNKGLEGVGVLRGGRYKGAVVAVAERRSGSKTGANRLGLIFAAKGTHRFYIKDRGKMDITSLAGLPNGDLLLLERRFRWSEGMKIRLRRIRAEDVRPDAVVDGEVLMEAGLEHEVDNMEGLAVHRGPGGEMILTLISDDNFNKLLQRTIVLQFQLDGAELQAGVK